MSAEMIRESITAACYLAAAVSFVLGIKGMTTVRSSRNGLRWAVAGMALAVIGTLVKTEIVSWHWIAIAVVIGSLIGGSMAVYMPMTAMPQRIALSHAFGALAAALVGIAEYLQPPHALDRFALGAIALEVLLGCLTFTGSLVAFAKLQGLIPGRPLVFPGQNIVNLSLLAAAVLIGVYLVAGANTNATAALLILAGLALLFGLALVMRIGGADMPTVIALLNSYAGLAAAAMGFVLENWLLVIAGAIDGASGFVLSIIMCKAMNRSFTNVLFGGFGQASSGGAGASGQATEARPVRSATAEEAAMLLEVARDVIVVPGYGMAVSQAQHKIRELGELLAQRGVRVRYAIHPVAGRMPGHMNVLLAEADVAYDHILDMDEINTDFAQADIALVVGANDVTNPAAQSDPDSPIYGMPILDVASAKTVMVVKRGMSSGFAGVENELYHLDKTLMLFGDAKAVADQLVREVSSAVSA